MNTQNEADRRKEKTKSNQLCCFITIFYIFNKKFRICEHFALFDFLFSACALVRFIISKNNKNLELG